MSHVAVVVTYSRAYLFDGRIGFNNVYILKEKFAKPVLSGAFECRVVLSVPNTC